MNGKPMNPSIRRIMAVTTLIVGALAQTAYAAEADAPRELSVYYFGNSFLENSVPWFHPTLAASAGERLRVASAIGPGWQIWMHSTAFERSGHWNHRREILGGTWDAVLIQHFASPGLNKIAPYMFDGPGRRWFYPPRGVGDVPAASEIIGLLESTRPDARVFIYSSWPGIPGAGDLAKRVRDEMLKSLESQGESREETLKRVQERKLTLAEMTPLMRAFDYGAAWLADYDEHDPEKSRNTHSRAYCVALMEGLKKNHPQMWAEGRLLLIPNGEVFYTLDRKMRAGQMPGIENVGFFSRDGGHVRAGLPRYTLAATCFAVMYGKHPGALDHAIYNDLENYKTEKLPQPGYVHQPDLGELLEITPERAKVVNDTIWEVVGEQSCTNIK
jgi:hypothetical protein